MSQAASGVTRRPFTGGRAIPRAFALPPLKTRRTVNCDRADAVRSSHFRRCCCSVAWHSFSIFLMNFLMSSRRVRQPAMRRRGASVGRGCARHRMGSLSRVAPGCRLVAGRPTHPQRAYLRHQEENFSFVMATAVPPALAQMGKSLRIFRLATGE